MRKYRRSLACGFILLGLVPPAATPATRKKQSAPAVSAQAKQAAVAHILDLAGRTAGTIENPAALVPFFEQLSHAPAGSLHILHYGDSHTASDDWADAMRQGLQSRFGVGGPGFALAGRPYRGYRRYDLSGNESEGWLTEGTVGHPGDGRNGLGGVSIAAHESGRTVSIDVDCSGLGVFYLRQPGGGQLEFLVDDVPSDLISTDGDLGPGEFHYKASPGPHQYKLRTISDSPVKLFGWVAENETGVTYETLGINGAQASMLLDWDEKILGAEIAERDPALIILAYGTNEAISPRWDASAYFADFNRLLERLRRAAPIASILVVGPPDCQFPLGRRHVPYPHLDQVIEVQRSAALAHGCAFWDWRARMGGAGSVTEWNKAGLGQPDHVHMTGAGYHLIGRMLLNAMLDQYNLFQAAKSE
jgi:lysophospholipase L1-like esterase